MQAVDVLVSNPSFKPIQCGVCLQASSVLHSQGVLGFAVLNAACSHTTACLFGQSLGKGIKIQEFFGEMT